MPPRSDFEELLFDLSSEGDDFVIVGAFAVMAHTEGLEGQGDELRAGLR